jgi:hypothetical protein
MNNPIDLQAELASEVIRVMNDEKLGLQSIALATSIVMSRRLGFGNTGEIVTKVRNLLATKPELLTHLHHNARPMNSADAHARWEKAQEAQQEENLLYVQPGFTVALLRHKTV